MNRESIDVDWDLLADHLGGALDDTPEQARVAQLVATDPDWRRAAAELSAAMDTVAAELRDLPTPVMPDEISDRLTRALPTAPDASRAPGGDGRRPGSGHVVRRRTSRRWRRPAPWLAAGALAGVAAFAVVAVGPWELLPSTGSDAVDGLAGAADDAEESTAFSAPGPLLAATGTDYTADDLPTILLPPESVTPSSAGAGDAAEDHAEPPRLTETDGASDVVPPELTALWADPWPCLSAVGQIAPEAEVTAADFASVDGEPAVVIWLSELDGSRWVWVVGPDCGQQPGDPDQRHVRRLG